MIKEIENQEVAEDLYTDLFKIIFWSSGIVHEKHFDPLICYKLQ